MNAHHKGQLSLYRRCVDGAIDAWMACWAAVLWRSKKVPPPVSRGGVAV